MATPKLLLVDDDPGSVRVMSRILGQLADQVVATTGEQALQFARRERPDLILLDADLPGLSGFEVCRELRRDPSLSQVPVIIATAHAQSEFEIDALDSGAVDFVSKPLEPELLRARVRYHLRAARARAEPKERLDDAPAARGDRPVILIADDDVDAIKTLTGIVAPLGEVHCATDGIDALDRVRSLAPDLLVVDARMPRMSGFELCAILKDDPAHRHMPVVFVTRYDDVPFEAQALDLGAADFIAKPFNSAVVAARLRNILALKRSNDAAMDAARARWRMLGDARVTEVVKGVGDGIVTFNAQGRSVLANPAACRLCGLPDAAAVGRTMDELLGADAARALAAAGADTVEATLPGGQGARVELSASTVGEAAEALTTVVMRDLSTRERLQQEADLRTRAEEHSRTKAMLMSYMAHEINNPLNGILGLATLMGADQGAPLGSEQSRRLRLLQSCALQIQALMGDLGDIGRMEADRLPIETAPTAVAECVADALAALAAQAELAGIDLRNDLPASLPLVLSDRGRLRQVLINVLSNAIKYNRRGGHVRVTAHADDDSLTLCVRDDGVGMTQAQIDNLFQPFNRLGRQQGPVAGSGLGLALSLQLIEAMGGRLTVESQPRQQTSVCIRLPRA